ncbi:MAG TPA: serine/threonine-protein kinase [Gemmatimonadaceae bacterium]|nr:serine/threonine-protein kinase [Gemmatimonadaceae bacterium]
MIQTNCANCDSALAPTEARFCVDCGVPVPEAWAPASAVSGDSLVEELRAGLAPTYLIEGELGRGGMAVVLRAVDAELGRRVALKVLPPRLALNEDLAARFLREAQVTASLDHAGIMPVYSVGRAGRTPYFAMKLIDGVTLDDVITAHGPMPVTAVLHVLRETAAALAYAHEHGVIHRDVKSGNIMLDRDGRVVVMDFGIARAVEEAALATRSTVVGTPHYMSPEQCAGRRVGPPCDQYALGVVAFQMLAGVVPFDADSLPAIIQHHLSTPAPDVCDLRPDAPPALGQIVRRLLAKKPGRRYATTAAVLAAVDAVPCPDGDRRLGAEIVRSLARGEAAGDLARAALHAAPTVPPAPARARGFRADLSRRLREAGESMRALAAGLRSWRPPHPHLVGAVAAIAAGLVLATATSVWAWRESADPSADLRRGASLYADGRRSEARAVFDAVVREHPSLALPHVYLGRIAREEGDDRSARRELQTATDLAPASATAARELGAVHLVAGRYDLARRAYARAVALDPSDRMARGYLGCSLARLGHAAEARRALREAGPGGWSGCGAVRQQQRR